MRSAAAFEQDRTKRRGGGSAVANPQSSQQKVRTPAAEWVADEKGRTHKPRGRSGKPEWDMHDDRADPTPDAQEGLQADDEWEEVKPENTDTHTNKARQQERPERRGRREPPRDPAANRSNGAPVSRAPAGPPAWQYKDPQGNIQGPCPSQRMLKWMDQGYFPPDTQVRSTLERGPWKRLQDVAGQMKREVATPAGSGAPTQGRLGGRGAEVVNGAGRGRGREGSRRDNFERQSSGGRGDGGAERHRSSEGRGGGRRGDGAERQASLERHDSGRGRGRGRGDGARVPLKGVARKLFSGEVQQGAEEPMWRYRDPTGTVQGPFPARNMIEWYDQGFLKDLALPVCGHERKVAPPNLPDERFYSPLGDLLDLVRKGGRFQPVSVEDVKAGVPPVHIKPAKPAPRKTDAPTTPKASKPPAGAASAAAAAAAALDGLTENPLYSPEVPPSRAQELTAAAKEAGDAEAGAAAVAEPQKGLGTKLEEQMDAAAAEEGTAAAEPASVVANKLETAKGETAAVEEPAVPEHPVDEAVSGAAESGEASVAADNKEAPEEQAAAAAVDKEEAAKEQAAALGGEEQEAPAEQPAKEESSAAPEPATDEVAEKLDQLELQPASEAKEVAAGPIPAAAPAQLEPAAESADPSAEEAAVADTQTVEPTIETAKAAAAEKDAATLAHQQQDDSTPAVDAAATAGADEPEEQTATGAESKDEHEDAGVAAAEPALPATPKSPVSVKLVPFSMTVNEEVAAEEAGESKAADGDDAPQAKKGFLSSFFG